MLINATLVIIGIIAVLWGADRLTDGAVSLAQRIGISEMIIGLTVVALGTSAPELCISLVSAFKGSTGLAVGNVVGSNIFNTLLIVGIAAMVTPITISRHTVKKDIPFAILASIMLIFIGLDGQISRLDAAILLLVFIGFMFYTLKTSKRDEKKTEGASPKYGIPASVFFFLLGLACLLLGSQIFVNSAVEIARALNISEAVIGLTIVAGGTSLPELATSVVAARKGQSAIAIGNVLGSNVFNILFILGTTGAIHPLGMNGITEIDLTVMTISIVLLWLFSYTKFKVERWEGAVMTGIFLGYITWIVTETI